VEQALETFWENSYHSWNMTVVDDASKWETQQVLNDFLLRYKNEMKVLRVTPFTGVTGRLRNLAVYWSEKHFGRGPLLYLSDNDAYFSPRWDKYLTEIFTEFENKFKLIGPYRHPYHLPREEDGIFLGSNGFSLASTDAVQGLGHLMRWETWDTHGPLDAHAPGTNQSEDFKFCQLIKNEGFLVGSIEPAVVYNCGLTGTNGQPSPGAECMQPIKGVYME